MRKRRPPLRAWRFRPAFAGDRPVASAATVEVSRHLL